MCSFAWKHFTAAHIILKVGDTDNLTERKIADTFQFLTFFKMTADMPLVSVLVLLLNHCYVVECKCDVSVVSAVHFRATCKNV